MGLSHSDVICGFSFEEIVDRFTEVVGSNHDSYEARVFHVKNHEICVFLPGFVIFGKWICTQIYGFWKMDL